MGYTSPTLRIASLEPSMSITGKKRRDMLGSSRQREAGLSANIEISRPFSMLELRYQREALPTYSEHQLPQYMPELSKVLVCSASRVQQRLGRLLLRSTFFSGRFSMMNAYYQREGRPGSAN